MKKVFTRPNSLKRTPFHYCAGCGHSIIHRLMCEVIDEMGLQDKTVGIPPAGCSVFAYYYFDVDMAEAAHGRGAAVATGLKRASPETIVFTYQGDGDLAAIGTAETIHAANRGERITVIYVNNAVYAMTGGQMAPTTLLEQQTTTTPYGRDMRLEGFPLKMSEMLALLDGAVYIERTAVNSPAGIRRTKKAIRKAFQTQIDDLGFSMVEILSPCPVNWKMTPLESWQWIDKEMTRVFPLGVVKDTAGKSNAD
ncbi:MAG: 2-oxoglutarate oxidoreductase [Chloroflexi bacterium]|nr:MAG: 2-oxoglutarate oxidoreductase [Chloroflexota bacterium]RLC95025.1 MAG: 2-oxoglutarate oxidoreductase [Chloroflexota bacterium]